MRNIDRVLLYKIIAGIFFIILCLTQLLHIRNMYNVENEKYNLEEKKIIQQEYERTITNDKLFPGAQKIIDSIIYRNFDRLVSLSASNPAGFRQFSDTVCDTLFCRLASANNLDAWLQDLKERYGISTDIDYGLVVSLIDIAPRPNHYLPLFDKNREWPSAPVPLSPEWGAKIGGDLTSLHTGNKAAGIIVSSPLAPSYRIGFALHADSPARLKQIILRMLPTILISLFSIVAILLIFLFTLINWQKQRKVSEMKSDFINTITHEFQTPLTAIMIANKTIENENGVLNSERLFFLNGVINRQAERLNMLVREVAATSNEQGIVLNLHEHRVNELVEEILADYKMNIQGKNIQLVFIKKTENDLTKLDKVYFISLLLNVLDNAVKYNHKPNKEIILTTSAANEKTLLLSVQDNGDGMSEKVRKHIFSRFYRDPSLTRSNEPGLGLGLYFAKKVLDAHKWNYSVKSREKVGTEFQIFIPLDPE
jgi:two-component system phosphate regulon sensor histidine kinase PhoR